MYSNVHCNIINSSQNVKTIQCPSTLKQTVVYPYNGILFSTKKEKIAHTWYNMNKLQKHYARPKKKKKAKFYDNIYKKCIEKASLEMKVDQ